MLAFMSGIFLAGWWAVAFCMVRTWWLDDWDEEWWGHDPPPIAFTVVMIMLLQALTLLWINVFTK